VWTKCSTRNSSGAICSKIPWVRFLAFPVVVMLWASTPAHACRTAVKVPSFDEARTQASRILVASVVSQSPPTPLGAGQVGMLHRTKLSVEQVLKGDGLGDEPVVDSIHHSCRRYPHALVVGARVLVYLVDENQHQTWLRVSVGTAIKTELRALHAPPPPALPLDERWTKCRTSLDCDLVLYACGEFGAAHHAHVESARTYLWKRGGDPRAMDCVQGDKTIAEPVCWEKRCAVRRHPKQNPTCVFVRKVTSPSGGGTSRQELFARTKAGCERRCTTERKRYARRGGLPKGFIATYSCAYGSHDPEPRQ